MTNAGASEDPPDIDEELAKYPSIVVHRGMLPESWFPKWLDRRLQARSKRKHAAA